MGAAELDEEALIEAVIRVRLSGAAESAKDVHAVLEGEGLGATLSQVKKAASKAAKRTGGTAAAAAAPEVAAAAAPSSEPAPLSKSKQKQEAKLAKGASASMKAAEQSMMDAQRKLRLAKAGAGNNGEVTIGGSVEEFIQYCAMKAVTGTLADGDGEHLKERIEADIATLEWVKLASASGALSLSEDVVALGGELQLTRLKEARDARDHMAARACFVEQAKREGAEEEASIDKLVSKSDKFAASYGQNAPRNALEEQD